MVVVGSEVVYILARTVVGSFAIANGRVSKYNISKPVINGSFIIWGVISVLKSQVCSPVPASPHLSKFWVGAMALRVSKILIVNSTVL